MVSRFPGLAVRNNWLYTLSQMQATLEALNAAVRVLGGISDFRPPSPPDPQLLQRYVPNAGALPPDELACEAVNLAIKCRAQLLGKPASLSTTA